MKKTISAALGAAFVLSSFASANASTIAFMTGTSDPWGQATESSAMDLAFGAGNWTKFNGFNASIFTSGYKFVYLDGGDGISTEFNNFVNGSLAAIQSYVSAGGALMMNAARWDQPVLSTGFGTSLTLGYSAHGSLTAAGVTAGLGGGGAGTSWTGNWFSHDVVGGGTCLVNGDLGCAFSVQTQGAGVLAIGGQTAPFFQTAGALQLRANELNYVASLASGVPEPSTWAMMIIGLGGLGYLSRRRRALAV